jgi:hypothetical protein
MIIEYRIEFNRTEVSRLLMPKPDPDSEQLESVHILRTFPCRICLMLFSCLLQMVTGREISLPKYSYEHKHALFLPQKLHVQYCHLDETVQGASNKELDSPTQCSVGSNSWWWWRLVVSPLCPGFL